MSGSAARQSGGSRLHVIECQRDGRQKNAIESKTRLGCSVRCGRRIRCVFRAFSFLDIMLFKERNSQRARAEKWGALGRGWRREGSGTQTSGLSAQYHFSVTDQTAVTGVGIQRLVSPVPESRCQISVCVCVCRGVWCRRSGADGTSSLTTG